MADLMSQVTRAIMSFSLLALVLVSDANAGGARRLDPKALVTPNPSAEAARLMSQLVDNYGHKTLAAQEEFDLANDEVTFIGRLTGHLPAIKSFDLGFYSPVSTWQDGVPDRIMEWGVSAKGIISLSWHWLAPSGGVSFETSKTTFDVSKAVRPGTKEYNLVVRDIDAISVLLEKFRDARLPILWRPLHEANGGWFWWGAHGSAPFKKLYRMMFERMTKVHHLNNLIWVWSTAVPLSIEWYPGDHYVDIVGADMYNRAGDHSPNAQLFHDMNSKFDGRKMLAYSESGSLPDPRRMFAEHAPWAWVNNWGGAFATGGADNSLDVIRQFYADSHVVTLDRLAVPAGSAKETPALH